MPRFNKCKMGRTTRMMQAVAKRANEGKHVYVVVTDLHLAHYCSTLIKDIVKEEYKYNIHFRAAIELPENSLSIRGTNKEDVFIDHEVLQQKYGPILKEWCRFDA